MGMTTCASSPGGKLKIIVSIALIKKVSVFMKNHGSNLDQIHEETLVNDCPATVRDVRHLIKIASSNTSIF